MQKLDDAALRNNLLNIQTVSVEYHNVKTLYFYEDFIKIEYHSGTGNEKTAFINRKYIVSFEILN